MMRAAWASLLIVLLVCTWAPCSGDHEVAARRLLKTSALPIVEVAWNKGSIGKPVGPQTIPFDFSGNGAQRHCKKAGKTCPERKYCSGKHNGFQVPGHQKDRCSLCYKPMREKDHFNCAACATNSNKMLSQGPDKTDSEFSPRGTCSNDKAPTSAAAAAHMTCIPGLGMTGHKSIECLKTGVSTQVAQQHVASENMNIQVVVYAAVTKHFVCKMKSGSVCGGKVQTAEITEQAHSSDRDLGEQEDSKHFEIPEFRKAIAATKAAKAATSNSTVCTKPKEPHCRACSVSKKGWCQQLCFVVNDVLGKRIWDNDKFKCRGGKDYKYHTDKGSEIAGKRLCCFKGCILSARAQRAFPFMTELQKTCNDDPAAAAIAAF